MPDTGAPWNIPYVEPSDLVRTYPAADELQALAIAAGLTDASLIKQVVQTEKTNTFTTSSSTFVTVTGLSATITPSSATSKILIIGQVNGFVSNSTASSYGFRITGGNTNSYLGNLVGSRPQAVTGGSWGTHGLTRVQLSHSLVFLDSPGTASAVTYNLATAAFTGTVFVNFSESDDNNDRGVRTASSITVIEVAA